MKLDNLLRFRIMLSTTSTSQQQQSYESWLHGCMKVGHITTMFKALQ